MAQQPQEFDDVLRKQVQSLMRFVNVTSCLRGDKVPCEIEQVLINCCL